MDKRASDLAVPLGDVALELRSTREYLREKSAICASERGLDMLHIFVHCVCCDKGFQFFSSLQRYSAGLFNIVHAFLYLSRLLI